MRQDVGPNRKLGGIIETTSVITSAVPVAIRVVALPSDRLALASFGLSIAVFIATTLLTLRGWRKAREAAVEAQERQMRMELERASYLETANALDRLFISLAGASAYIFAAIGSWTPQAPNRIESARHAINAMRMLVGEPNTPITGAEPLAGLRAPLRDYALIRPELHPITVRLWEETPRLAALIEETTSLLEDACEHEVDLDEVTPVLSRASRSLDNWRTTIAEIDSLLRQAHIAAVMGQPLMGEITVDSTTPHVVASSDGWRIEGELTA